MAKNDINSNFNQIAVTDASDNVLGIRAAVGNVQITGGANGQVLSTNGSGVLSWATPTAGTPTTGSATMATNINVPQNTSPTSATTLITFTLPSAGVWDVSYFISASTASNTQNMAAGIFTPAGAVIVGTESTIYAQTVTFIGILTSREFITTTGAATYTIRGWQPAGTSIWQAQTSVNGRSIVKWLKVG